MTALSLSLSPRARKRLIGRGLDVLTWLLVVLGQHPELAQRVRADGQVEGICYATTAAYDAVYYANRPTRLDAMQGYGPVLMAGAEVITMLRQFDIDHTLNTFHYRPKGTAKTPGGTP